MVRSEQHPGLHAPVAVDDLVNLLKVLPVQVIYQVRDVRSSNGALAARVVCPVPLVERKEEQELVWQHDRYCRQERSEHDR